VGVQKETVLASVRSIVTVEEVVDELEPLPGAIVLPHWVVTCVAEAPRGARPSYTQGYYDRDNRAYRDWDPIARDREKFQRWLDEEIFAQEGASAS
jgi:glutaconate CoA-transferase subunit A